MKKPLACVGRMPNSGYRDRFAFEGRFAALFATFLRAGAVAFLAARVGAARRAFAAGRFGAALRAFAAGRFGALDAFVAGFARFAAAFALAAGRAFTSGSGEGATGAGVAAW
ncbi:MAG TPA: hypothetical protein VFK90_06295, partial [Anaeromyxobacter sp.]|nr:hypothetical protein [Anaeromyxobacter sp.]